MIKVDLITGFLGSGKTTFIRKYAEHLMEKGQNIGIIENDFGAINIDMMMLQDLEGDNCELEPIVGGNVVEDWKRRFKAKLISMAMRGFDRVIVEPSGIYDVDAFFDMLYDEPLDKWYEIGNIFALVDAKLDERLSEQAEYLLTSQIANAGKVILSKAQDATMQEQEKTVARINQIMEKYDCERSFVLPELEDTMTQNASEQIQADRVFCKDWNKLTEQDFTELENCGYTLADHKKLWFDKNEMFTSLFFMNTHITEKKLCETVTALMRDEACGKLFRMKGFVKKEDGSWLALNATHDHLVTESVEQGQEVLIVIGENLVEEKIRQYLE